MSRCFERDGGGCISLSHPAKKDFHYYPLREIQTANSINKEVIASSALRTNLSRLFREGLRLRLPEHRLSNFLLWQSAYAELSFVETLWPDFTKAKFLECLEEYAQRERRFGAVSEAVA